MRMLFKKMPANVQDKGREIGLLKKYFEDDYIDAPERATNKDSRERSISYSVNVLYQKLSYKYLIKVYKTKGYMSDRRLILPGNDPLARDIVEGDYLCFLFNEKITNNSEIEILRFAKSDMICKEIEKHYDTKKGLVMDETDKSGLFKLIKDSYSVNKSEIDKKMQSLNIILYGPPGTGKTDSTIERALEILDKHSLVLEESDRRKENRRLFRQWQNRNIFFITMHPNYSYEDFVQGIKPKVLNDNQLIFETKDGRFKEVVELAHGFEIISKNIYFPFYLLSIYEDDLKKVLDKKNLADLIRHFAKIIKKDEKIVEKWRDIFDNHVGSRSHRNGFAKKSLKGKEVELWGKLKIYTDIFDKVPKDKCFALLKKNWLEEKSAMEFNDFNLDEVLKEKYVLILDEINRANISKVFGELITLIEDDKRAGNENQLSVTLPMGEIFSIPRNLYIIGTMNTADKSIALVDLALRRRFQFIPIYPDSNIIRRSKEKDAKGKAILLEEINRQLCDRKNKEGFYKGVDFQIGHGYFLKGKEISDVLNENIIPLLIEYFRNDLDKVMKFMVAIHRPADDQYYQKTGLVKYSTKK